MQQHGFVVFRITLANIDSFFSRSYCWSAISKIL